jgi:hypothetical protein
MAEPEPPNAGSEEGGLFGKLPSTRPGVRSPRRDSGKPAGAPKRARPAPPPKARAAPKATAPKRGGGREGGSPAPGTRPSTAAPRRQPPPATPEDGEGRGEAPGVEDLAWAGITVAAEAATLGVRLLSRAVDAVRKPPDPG